jgi:hypothetical protein
MNRAWQLTATRTIDLGWDQMILCEGQSGARPRVLFGGVWLADEGDRTDPTPTPRNDVRRPIEEPAAHAPLAKSVAGRRLAGA